MEALFDGEAEQLSRKAIELALNGNPLAIKLCLERILPARRDRPIEMNLPPVQSAKQVSEAMGTVIGAITEAQVTPNEGQTLANLLAMQSEFIEAARLEERVYKLERNQTLDVRAEDMKRNFAEMTTEEALDDPEPNLTGLEDFDDAA
jgi:hypothetical protein